MKNLGDPHWLCNNATLQGSSTIPLTTTIDSPYSSAPQQCFPTLKISLSFRFQDLQLYLSPIEPALQWFHKLPLHSNRHPILHHICMPIHFFINRTNFIPYRALYAVEFYINFGRNFHWLFHFIWICF